MLQEEEAIREELEAAEEPEVYRAVLRLNSVHLIRVVSPHAGGEPAGGG